MLSCLADVLPWVSASIYSVDVWKLRTLIYYCNLSLSLPPPPLNHHPLNTPTPKRIVIKILKFTQICQISEIDISKILQECILISFTIAIKVLLPYIHTVWLGSIKVGTKSGHGDIKRLDFCNFQVYITLSWTLVFCSYEWVTALKPPIPHLFLCVSPLEFFDRVKGFLASSFTCRNDLVSHPVAEGAWVILEISQSGPTMLTKFKVIPCDYFIQILKKNIIN